jgi:hypothetical protein
MRGMETLERLAVLYARIALGGAFLSGIASRFGLWGKNAGYGSFSNFVRYTAEVNAFMPAFTIPFLAYVLETEVGGKNPPGRTYRESDESRVGAA